MIVCPCAKRSRLGPRGVLGAAVQKPPAIAPRLPCSFTQAASGRPSSARATCRCRPRGAAGRRRPPRACCCTGARQLAAAQRRPGAGQFPSRRATVQPIVACLLFPAPRHLVPLPPPSPHNSRLPPPPRSVDESLVFDPTDLAEDVTPAATLKALGQVRPAAAAGQPVRLLPVSLSASTSAPWHTSSQSTATVHVILCPAPSPPILCTPFRHPRRARTSRRCSCPCASTTPSSCSTWCSGAQGSAAAALPKLCGCTFLAWLHGNFQLDLRAARAHTKASSHRSLPFPAPQHAARPGGAPRQPAARGRGAAAPHGAGGAAAADAPH